MSGGFLNDGGGSYSQEIPNSNKTRGANSITPVTIKIVLDAKINDGEGVKIQVGGDVATDVSTVSIVAAIRQVKETGASTDFLLEDGTGTISGKCWQDKGFVEDVVSGSWGLFHGSIRALNGSKTLNIFSVHRISDFNMVTLHFLQVYSLFLPKNSGSNQNKSLFSNLSPVHQAIVNIYAACNAPQGLHYASVVRSLADKYRGEDVKQGIMWLIAEGYLFETHDSDHAKLLDQA